VEVSEKSVLVAERVSLGLYFCRLRFRLRAALLCVDFHYFSLHISAHMAIFKCVGYFIFICLKDSASQSLKMAM
jgi:hypothetical protein